ncbi:DNA polymerase I B, chloroplastic/mitochondrial isoform X2 [Magnolia sinica]|uniref:DNA polymerase I B, chloroplastic/mitochondrial isoform X2 n=1 Tax=Magnolia sinica TaxID=86752 RepID=UPI00265915C2|nr:DNA polymerase I B, chloroplastic/mitochondrial isoform X2 [Magnolia sinica]
MAMGVSTQGGPFKPCYTPSLWFSSSFRRSSSAVAATPFHAPGKGFQRQEIHSLHSADDPCTSITSFGSPGMRHSSAMVNRQTVMKGGIDSIGAADYCCSSSRLLNFKVHSGLRSSPSPNGHAFPLTSNNTISKGKYVPVVVYRRADDGNGAILHQEIVAWVDAIPTCRVSDYRIECRSSLSETYECNSRCLWLEESKKVKESRLNQQVRHNVGNDRMPFETPQDDVVVKAENEFDGLRGGSTYERGGFSTTSLSSLRFDNIADKGAPQNSLSQQYIGYGMGDPQGMGELTRERESHMPIPKCVSDGEIFPPKGGDNAIVGNHWITDDVHSSHVISPLNGVGVGGNKPHPIAMNSVYHARQKEYTMVGTPHKMDLSEVKIAGKGVRPNGPSSLSNGQYIRPCELPAKGGNNTIPQNHLINDDCRSSHAKIPSNRGGVGGSKNIVYHARTNEHIMVDTPQKVDLSAVEIVSRGVRSNGSLAQKLLVESEVDASEVAGVRPGGVVERDGISDGGSSITDAFNDTYTVETTPKESGICRNKHREQLARIYNEVLVVDDVLTAKRVVEVLTTRYKHLVHACDTEVAKIDVKQETPVGHGEIICFSIYSGPQVDFGNGKNCIWVDVLDGGRDLLMEFAPFFKDPSIKKVWHNYSFDSHIIENYGFEVSGFHADTMHLARLWDSSRRTEGGYSLEALTGDPKVMSGANSHNEGELIAGKISMKSIFGKKKLKKDGTEGKLITIAAVEELQRGDRIPWICYSALDSMSTLRLFESLKAKLMGMDWVLDGVSRGSMYDFYEEYWRPFGELLVKMESEGMLVDRAYLSEIEKVATMEQQIAAERFRKWASKHCPDAKYMNVGSDTQLRQLFFGGTVNSKDQNETLPEERTFKVPNVDKVIEEGKKVATKFCNIKLHKIGEEMQTDMYTATGWPSMSGAALKTFAGKISGEYDSMDDVEGCQSADEGDEISSERTLDEDEERGNPVASQEDADTSAYGTAYTAFGGGKEGREACHAIAALCEICSIDSLISNFILPLQGSHISGTNGRVHCSLNINTETGRLSARRPSLQNQPALEKDRYKIRQAFIAAPGNSLIVADYGQLELRILAHLANCKSMLNAFKAGGDFHSRTAMNMYPHIREAVEEKRVLLEWYPQPGEDKPPVPLLKDAFASERRKAKMLNFSIAYGKTPVGLARDWKVSVKEARETVNLWYKERREVLSWQQERKKEAHTKQCVYTLLGRTRRFPSLAHASNSHRGHIERAAINTPVQGSAADVAMCAMLEISRNARLKELGWRLLLQVHDEVILEGPTESSEIAKAIVVECMSKPFYGTNFLKVDLAVSAKCEQNWYAAK